MRIILLAITGLLMCATYSCTHHDHSHDHDHDNASEQSHDDTDADEHHHEGDEVALSSTQQQRMGIGVSTIQPQPFSGILKVGGTLVSSPTDAVTIVAPAAGQVVLSPHTVEGAEVKSNTTLFTIDTETLTETSAAMRARLALDAAQRRLARAKSLLPDQLVSQREYDDMQADYDAALAEFTAATRSGDTRVNVRSSMSGYITASLVGTGDYVQAGQALATVTRGRSMLLCADVPERLFARLSDIVSARFKPSYADDVLDIDSLSGKLMAREVSAQQNGGYLTVTFAFENRHNLVPGCYADIWLVTRQHHDALCVPLNAIVREGDLYFVFVQEDDTCFEKHEVRLGDDNGTLVEITSGLTAGDRVVTQGAAQLALAASARVIPAHSHNH